MKALCSLLAALVLPVSAIYADEAYTVDYHYSLLGLPRANSTFFHQPNAASKASLIYTLSEKNLLGAINPKDGTVVWRQRLGLGSHLPAAGIVKTSEEQDRIFAMVGHEVNTWTATDGKLIWETSFGNDQLRDLQVLGMDSITADGLTGDAVVALQSQAKHVSVVRLDGNTGHVKWIHEDSSGDSAFRLAKSSTKTYLLSLHSKLVTSGLKIKVTILESSSGEKIGEYSLNSDNEVKSPEDVIFVGNNKDLPLLAWTDANKQVLKLSLLGAKHGTTTEVKLMENNLDRIDMHNHDQSLLIHYQGENENWAEVYQINQQMASIEKTHAIAASSGRATYSASLVDGQVFFTRIDAQHTALFSASSGTPVALWSSQNVKIPGLLEQPYPVHAASEVVVRAGASYAVRSVVLMSTGDWVLIRNGELGWTRHESLAGVIKAKWAALKEDSNFIAQLEEEEDSAFITAFLKRFKRHSQSLDSIGSWLKNVQALLKNALPALLSTHAIDSSKNNAFGFNQVVLAATENGRMFALDAGDLGRVLWNFDINLQGNSHDKWTTQMVENVFNPLAFTAHNYADQQFKNGTSLTRHELDILDSSRSPQEQVLIDEQKISGQDDSITYAASPHALTGYKANIKLWHFTPKLGEQITKVQGMLPNEPVASIGKALGDRSVLYKYLNRNAIVVLTIQEASSTVSAYLLDAVSGALLHSAHHTGVDTSRPFIAAISENWLTYAFTAYPKLESTSKGFTLVMTELYESSIANDRGSLAGLVNYSSTSPTSLGSKPHVVSQAFHIPEEISSIAVTQTRQGITSRQIIVTLPNSNSLVAIPRQALDPRRTLNRDPAAPELEEGLSRYHPMLEFDPQWYINHREEIFNVDAVMTTPATLESTCLVFAYGLDVFGTRIAPSFAFDILGSSFNKIQLVLTVAALTIGVFVVAPIIQRKQTDALWKNP